jgi:hypothetical protein
MRLCDVLGLAMETNGCEGEHQQAERIMNAMGNFDISASIAFFRAHGGYCDCEILFNVEASYAHKANKSRS